MRRSHNAEYGRALKSMASSADKTLVHYVFSQWRDVLIIAPRGSQRRRRERRANISGLEGCRCWSPIERD